MCRLFSPKDHCQRRSVNAFRMNGNLGLLLPAKPSEVFLEYPEHPRHVA